MRRTQLDSAGKLPGKRAGSGSRGARQNCAETMLTLLMDSMLVKTQEYLEHFARFKRKENVEAVERLLSAHKELAKFERAQLGKYLPPKLLRRY